MLMTKEGHLTQGISHYWKIRLNLYWMKDWINTVDVLYWGLGLLSLNRI